MAYFTEDAESIELRRYLLADLLWFLRGQLSIDSDESPFNEDHVDALLYGIQLTKEQQHRLGIEEKSGLNFRQALTQLVTTKEINVNFKERNRELVEENEQLRAQLSGQEAK